jgi:RNA polymerase sigma-70 factor (ECF subfamily)
LTTGAGTHSSALFADRSPLSDGALVAAARKGDMKAFERLYRLHSGKVLGLCLRMTRRRDVAEDCVQQTFIRAWRSLAAFEGRSAFGTWLHRIAVNEVLTYQRNHGTRAESDSDAVDDAHAEPVELQRGYDATEVMDVERALATLPPGSRHVVVLQTVYGYSHEEVAEMLGIAAAACCASAWVCRRRPMSEFDKTGRDPLDEALASLPQDVAPPRELWPQIRAEIEKTPIAAPASRVQANWFRLAAAVLLVLATSFVTYYVTRQSMQQQIATAPEALPTPQVISQPASFNFGSERLGSGYVNARAELEKRFEEHIAALPAADRAKIERNLADLRRAADEISATLAKNPSDPLLQDLLMSTYQSELQLLANVSELPTAGSMRTDL